MQEVTTDSYGGPELPDDLLMARGLPYGSRRLAKCLFCGIDVSVESKASTHDMSNFLFAIMILCTGGNCARG